MLPARDGDCLVIEYGEPGQVRRIMVDTGRASTSDHVRSYFGALPKSDRTLQLLVVTHVDADHIEGALKLAADRPPGFDCREVWFNSYRHLDRLPDGHPREAFGAAQGDKFSAAADAAGWRLNSASGGSAISVAADGSPARFELEGGLALTVLSPDTAKLLALRRHWARAIARANLNLAQLERPEPPQGPPPRREAFGGIDVALLAGRQDRPDAAIANGSSIAFVAEYAGRRLLLAADAHPDILASSLAKLSPEGARYRIDLLKVPHHGSASNLTRRLLGALECSRFAFSTDGSQHGHPDDEAIAKALVSSPPGTHKELVFNYRSPGALKWNEEGLKGVHGYSCRFPDCTADGRIDVDV